MVVARSGHVAALLPNGQVLIAGGVDTPTNGTSISTAEVYNPTTGTFSLIGTMTAARRYITTSGEAVLLDDGRVLIAGGIGAGQAVLDSAELFGPTGFSATGPMSNARFLHATALLESGEVLVAGGGTTAGVLNTADLFSPGGSFSPTGPMTTPRLAHTATLLPDGQVLIVGGSNASGFLASAELYNTANGNFTLTGSMATPRRDHIAVLLPTGDVLVAGGEDSNDAFATAELYVMNSPPLCAGVRDTIVSNFNGTPIRAGNFLWFNSVLKVNGLGATPVTIALRHATVQFTTNNTPFNVSVPDADITFDPHATTATTSFNTATERWETTVPSFGLSGNTFLTGEALPIAADLPGGINPVTWSAQFISDTPGVTVAWQWAAALYTNFTTALNGLGVKPVDDNRASVFKNADHAGTPENFKQSVIGGARGGGGSNFTGSYSGTKT
jgi:hypothetical protein